MSVFNSALMKVLQPKKFLNGPKSLYEFFESEFQRKQVGEKRKETVIKRISKTIRKRWRDLGAEEEEQTAAPSRVVTKRGRRPTTDTNNKQSPVAAEAKAGMVCVGDSCTLDEPIKIFVDGPFGAPASNFYQAKHAVLVATGIGVTPMAAILQSVMHRYWNVKKTCPNCAHSWADEMPSLFFNLSKGRFHLLFLLIFFFNLFVYNDTGCVYCACRTILVQ